MSEIKEEQKASSFHIAPLIELSLNSPSFFPLQSRHPQANCRFYSANKHRGGVYLQDDNSNSVCLWSEEIGVFAVCSNHGPFPVQQEHNWKIKRPFVHVSVFCSRQRSE